MFRSISDRGLRQYFEEISKFPVLSKEEEFKLAKKIREKDDEQAKERLICSNLRIVVYIAKRFQHQGLSLSELINAGNEGLIPSNWVSRAVGGNSLRANFFASVAGAFMYFATLTEVPILQGLMGAGMGKGPALALLLAGPALSLPNMLVIRSVMGTRKTIVFVLLVIMMATISGIIFGAFF